MHNLQPCARRAHKHPIIDIYLPIVGRIYPIPEYICQLLAEYIQYQNISANCWQNISNIRIYSTIHIFPIVGSIYIQYKYMKYNLPGSNLPGPDLPSTKFPGPNLPPWGPICRGPICRGPICRHGAQSAGARFAKKWQIGPQKVRGPICRQIDEGPNLPRTLPNTWCRANQGWWQPHTKLPLAVTFASLPLDQ